MAQKLGGRLHYVYFIALGDDPRNPGNLLIVNAFKLLRFLKTREVPDMRSLVPEHVWVLRMFKGNCLIVYIFDNLYSIVLF